MKLLQVLYRFIWEIDLLLTNQITIFVTTVIYISMYLCLVHIAHYSNFIRCALFLTLASLLVEGDH